MQRAQQILLLVALVLLGSASAAKTTVSGSDFKFYYVGKASFGMDPAPEKLAGVIELNFRTKGEHLHFIVVYDDPDQWPSVYMKNQTCEKADSFGGGASIVPHDNYNYSVSLTQKARPRFWYVALFWCPGNNVTAPAVSPYVKVTMHSYDTISGEVNYHERDLFLVFLVFTIMDTVFLFLFVFYQRNNFGRLHYLEKIFMISLVCELVYNLLETVNFHIRESAGNLPMGEAPAVFRAVAILMLSAFFLVISDGYGISKSEYPDKEWAIQVGFLNFCGYFIIIFSSLIGLDIGLSVSIYNSYGGYFLVATFLLTDYIFIVLCIRLRKEPFQIGKRTSIFIFCISGALLFLSYPVTVILSIAVDPWERYRTVTTVFSLMVTFCYLMSTFYLSPKGAPLLFNFDRSSK